MLRRTILFALALIAALLWAWTLPSARAEGLSAEVETPPAEVGEFDLSSPEPEPSATPEPTAEQTPLPTLEPGSVNYPEEKINFENEIWAVLTRKWGLADFQAAGLMSSLYAESSFCPYNVEGRDGVDNRGSYTFRPRDSVGFGLCQWTTPRRKSGLYRYAVSHGDANLVWDFDIQMGYMKGEISLSGLKATETLYEATEWAVLHFERPNLAYENSWPGTRYGSARLIYQAHAGKAYEEPRPRFEIVDDHGNDLSEGLRLDGETSLIIRSNYYWRLSWDGSWLSVRCPQIYDPQAWERCQCGYGGETRLTLKALVPPLARSAELRFTLYCGSGVAVAVPVEYEGPTLIDLAREYAPALAALARLLIA